MTDLDRLIAEADPDGKLEKVREYEAGRVDFPLAMQIRADAALAEALHTIKWLAKERNADFAKWTDAEAVIVRLGKELEKSEELVLRLNEVAASLVRRVHTYITSDSDARDKLANGVGHDMSRIPSLEPFLAQRATEGGDHD